MTDRQLLDLLGEMSDRHVLSPDQTPRARKRRPVRTALIAACVCAAVVGTALAASPDVRATMAEGVTFVINAIISVLPGRIEAVVSSEEPGKVEIGSDVNQISAEQYTAYIQDRLENPTGTSDNAQDWETCLARLGIASPEIAWLSDDYDWDRAGHFFYQDLQFSTHVTPGAGGSLFSADARANLTVDGLHVELHAEIFGESGEPDSPYHFFEGAEFYVEEYQSASGLPVSFLTVSVQAGVVVAVYDPDSDSMVTINVAEHIADAGTAPDGFSVAEDEMIYAFFALGDVQYTLSVNCSPIDHGEGMALAQELLDQIFILR